MTKSVKLVLFDLDNVLYDYDRRARAACLATLSGGDAEAIHAAIWDSGLERSGDNGVLSRQEYLRAFGDRIGYRLTLGEWLEARRISTQPNHVMLGIVKRIRELADVAILTNNTELVTDHIDALCPDLRPLFGAKIHASACFHAAKPDVECYRQCLDALGVEPGAVLFVDDLAENVEGAREAGLHAHHFTSAEGFRHDLRRYGLQTEQG